MVSLNPVNAKAICSWGVQTMKPGPQFSDPGGAVNVEAPVNSKVGSTEYLVLFNWDEVSDELWFPLR